MKTRRISIILLLAIAFASCQNDLEKSHLDDGGTGNEVVVADGKIQNPKWLIHVVDSIARSYQPSPATHEYISPSVYSVSHEEQEYIQVLDMLNSCYTCGNLFFSVSGEPVSASDPLNAGLYEALSKEENRTLISR